MMPSSSLFLEIDLPMKPCLLWFHKKFEENGQNLTKKIQNGSNLPPCPPNLFARLCCVVAECYSSAPELIKVAIYNCIETLPHCTLAHWRWQSGSSFLFCSRINNSNLPLSFLCLQPPSHHSHTESFLRDCAKFHGVRRRPLSLSKAPTSKQ